MKYDKALKTAVIPGLVAAAAVLLFLGLAHVDSLVGFAAVVAIVSIAAIEYRPDWKHLIGR